MQINHYTNYCGEELHVPVKGYTNSFFDISMYGVTNPSPAYELYLNPHGYHVFEYVISGEGYIDYDDKHIKVSAGDFYYLKKGFVGHYYANAENPYKKIWVNAVGTMLDDLAATFEIESPVITSNLGKPLESSILAMHAHLDGNEELSDNEILRRCAVNAFEMLSLAAGNRLIEQRTVYLLFSDSVKQFIKTNITAGITLESIAEHFHLNPSHLIRRFKKETGMTPMRYYNLCRIDAARSLLIWQRTPIRLVADKLNYPDSAYFSSCFKRETGVSPSEYTQEMHKEYTNGRISINNSREH